MTPSSTEPSISPPMRSCRSPPFTGPRIDYSLHRLAHYTATQPEHYQNFVLFTNYQFYVDEFVLWAKQTMAEGSEEYDSFVEIGNQITPSGHDAPVQGVAPLRQPQMPAYHLTRPDRNGISLVNIGVGPSNAKTITDHIAVLRPHAWLMLGHCAGLRNTQRLGDYVLAHGYVREDPCTRCRPSDLGAHSGAGRNSGRAGAGSGEHYGL